MKSTFIPICRALLGSNIEPNIFFEIWIFHIDNFYNLNCMMQYKYEILSNRALVSLDRNKINFLPYLSAFGGNNAEL